MADFLSVLRQLWPHGNDKVAGLIEGIAASAPEVFSKYGLNSPLLIAHAMAQFSHECGAGLEVVENLNYSASGLMKTWPKRFDADKANAFAHKPQKIANEVYNGRMGNRSGSDDGWNFRGRGAAQTTGREAYTKLGQAMGLDLVNNPDLVNDPKHFLECGVADFVKLCGCLPYAANDDVEKVTLHLNGGYIGLAERKDWLAKWKKALGSATVADPPAMHPKQVVATSAVVGGATVAALQAHTIELAIGIAAAGIIVALLVHFLWPKKG